MQDYLMELIGILKGTGSFTNPAFKLLARCLWNL